MIIYDLVNPCSPFGHYQAWRSDPVLDRLKRIQLYDFLAVYITVINGNQFIFTFGLLIPRWVTPSAEWFSINFTTTNISPIVSPLSAAVPFMRGDAHCYFINERSK